VDRATAAGAIEEAGLALTDAGRAAADAPVPSCPGWTVSTVVKHVGLVHTWAAGMLRSYPSEPAPFPKAPPEVTDEELPDWADTQRDALVRAVGQSDGQREMWAFGRPRPASFWWRRQAVETCIHAWDATNAVSAPFVVPAPVGMAGMEELFDGILPRRFAGEPPQWGTRRTIHFHRTDGDGEWLLTLDDPPEVSVGHAKGDLAVRGPAAELLLWAYNRRGSGVELLGDQRLAEGWARNVQM
jgi:uncharacterized protein (TIGR03083 family)